MQRIIDHASTPDKARAEYRIPALVQQLVITSDIAAVIGLVRHHDHHGIALAMVDAIDDGTSEPMVPEILSRPQGRHLESQAGEHRPGGVRTAVVHYDDLVSDSMQPQFRMQVLDGGDN